MRRGSAAARATSQAGAVLLGLFPLGGAAVEAGVSQEPGARVENIQFVAAEGGIVRVLYDLRAGPTQQLVGVRLLVSLNGGQTYELVPSSVSGDVGPAVVPGPGKQIVWEWARDVERLDADRLRVRIDITIIAAARAPRSRWGVGVNLAPSWRVPDRLDRALFQRNAEYSLRGSDFRISLVRGHAGGRDWGVSLVRKRVAAGSFIRREIEFNGSVSTTTLRATRSIWLTGGDVHLFLPVARFGRRHQIGVLLAGGLTARPSGTVERRVEGPIFAANPLSTFPTPRIVSEGPGYVVSSDFGALPVPAGQRAAVDAVHAAELYRHAVWGSDVQALARIEAAYAVTLSDRFRVRVSGGLNVPGTQILAVDIVHLFGTSRVPRARVEPRSVAVPSWE